MWGRKSHPSRQLGHLTGDAAEYYEKRMELENRHARSLRGQTSEERRQFYLDQLTTQKKHYHTIHLNDPDQTVRHVFGDLDEILQKKSSKRPGIILDVWKQEGSDKKQAWLYFGDVSEGYPEGDGMALSVIQGRSTDLEIGEFRTPDEAERVLRRYSYRPRAEKGVFLRQLGGGRPMVFVGDRPHRRPEGFRGALLRQDQPCAFGHFVIDPQNRAITTHKDHSESQQVEIFDQSARQFDAVLDLFLRFREFIHTPWWNPDTATATWEKDSWKALINDGGAREFLDGYFGEFVGAYGQIMARMDSSVTEVERMIINMYVRNMSTLDWRLCFQTASKTDVDIPLRGPVDYDEGWKCYVGEASVRSEIAKAVLENQADRIPLDSMSLCVRPHHADKKTSLLNHLQFRGPRRDDQNGTLAWKFENGLIEGRLMYSYRTHQILVAISAFANPNPPNESRAPETHNLAHHIFLQTMENQGL